MGRPVIDLTGRRFVRLLVIERAPRAGHGRLARWSCRCDCGRLVEACGQRLRGGHARSCGCLVRAARTTREVREATERVDLVGGSGRNPSSVRTTIHVDWQVERKLRAIAERLGISVAAAVAVVCLTERRPR